MKNLLVDHKPLMIHRTHVGMTILHTVTAVLLAADIFA